MQADLQRDEERIRLGACAGVGSQVDMLPENGVQAEVDPEWAVLRDKLITHFGVAWRKRELRWRKTAQVLGRGVAGEHAAFTASRGYRDRSGAIFHPDKPEGWDDSVGEEEQVAGAEGEVEEVEEEEEDVEEAGID
ncbi:hypothetical protein AB1Y20_018806 [Prymnesium parvum]|uniref:Uncharacterized protein n=1 Tax=Prymnesium parvum TaxID=97485 RepID=A0AB34JSA3_PRYPA